MKKKNISSVIAMIVLLGLVFSAAFAYFSSNSYILGANSTTNLAIDNSEYNLTVSTGSNLTLNIDTLYPENNTVMGHATTNDTVSLENNSAEKDSICYYSIYYTPTGDTFNNSHGNSEKELVITGSDSSNQNKSFSFDLNGISAKTKMYGGFIYTNSENSNITQTWTFNLIHYSLSSVNQEEHLNHSYSGQISFEAEGCHATTPTDENLALILGSNGSDADGQNKWAVVEDHGIRYVGQNPSNFVWFNCSDLSNQNASTCERWRIIGVFEEKYDTNDDGVPDTEGDLIKIIRNDSLGHYSWDYKQSGVGSSTSPWGSNDWSDSQLMMMLNPSTFLNSGYVTESDASPVHNWSINGEYVRDASRNIYRNMGSYFDGAKTAYKPASTSPSGWSSTTQADASTFKRMSVASQSMIATTKWYLTGWNTNAITTSAFYEYERNTSGTGAVYNANRPKIWYGKVGLMYPSDYGFATNGNPNSATYNRQGCLNYYLYGWSSSNYQENCADNSWLSYVGATGNTSATKGTKYNQWTITPHSTIDNYVFFAGSGSVYGHSTYLTNAVRPVLYLSTSTKITSGDGSYNSPYTLAQ